MKRGLALAYERDGDDLYYSNFLEVGYNTFEFVLQFSQRHDGQEQPARKCIRVVTSPFYAKRFSELLAKSIRRYERDHGSARGGES